MNRFQVHLTDEQLRALKQAASRQGVPVARVIRDAVDRHLARGGAAGRERAIAALGGFRSGLSDVSENHDRYLAESW
jgi:hypothetical protein